MCLQLIATLQFLTYSRYHPPIPQPIPTDTQKPWQICLESPVATTALDYIMKTHICNLFCQHQMDQVYVCLVLFSLHFIHAVCLTVSLFLFLLSELMGKYSRASREEQCGIQRLRSKIQAASRRCRHSTNKKFQKKHTWIGGGEEPNTGNGC